MALHRSIQVDRRLCEAHALCVELAPDVFDLTGDVATVEKQPDGDDVNDVDAAVSACPRQAISWIGE